MQIQHTSFTVATYCSDLLENRNVINRDYQRSRKVWPVAAQSFLIESMLLGYPVPKMSLYQITQRDTRQTTREIVDGQQRTEAIRQFFEGTLTLSRTLEYERAAGRSYEELDGELQDRFLSYELGFDLIVDATPKDVREIFRRINSYEVPLNYEEQRHAKFQGDFKWFIYHLSKKHDDHFEEIGTFTDKQLVRMADMKLLTDVSHALINGIKTTSKKDLDKLYEEYDEDFSEFEDDLELRIDSALDYILEIDDIFKSPLIKPYSLYSLLLAVCHAERSVPNLEGVAPGGGGLATADAATRSLADLAAALEAEVPEAKFTAFVNATEKATNTKDNREARFKALLDAVTAQV